jgi:ferritin
MLKQSVQDAMNEQIKNELYSAYFYLAMAAYFESTNFKGFARWMELQAKEEQSHAMKLYEFINERGGRVELRAIDQPPLQFESPLDVFEKVLSHEQLVTSLIHDLYALAVGENDYASQMFLQWFVSEQVEEEANATEIVEQLKMVGDKGHALLMMDRALGQRSG